MFEVQGGCATAFGLLYRRYSDRAHGVARSVCRDNGRADEAVQEAFASIWKTRTSYQSQAGSVAGWVLTIVRYRAIDVARRNGPHELHRAGEYRLRVLHAPDTVPEQVERRALAQDVRGFVDLLPDAQREVISLAFYRGLTHTEIADFLAIPVGTVKSRIRLGLQRLRRDAAGVAG